MIRNIFKHLGKIIKHKWWVMYYCFKCGLYFQGITHDMSKFSPTEFFESVKYYNGKYSPIDACKKVNGYSMAWFHHRGRNKHHWEFWIDNFSQGMTACKMPFKYALEMFCDFMGAGRAYYGNDFSVKSEYEWWQKKKREVIMYPKTYTFINMMFECINDYGIDETFKQKKWLYEEIKPWYENDNRKSVKVKNREFFDMG